MSSSSDLEASAFHPLMDHVHRPITRRAALLGACGLLAARMPATARQSSGTPEIQIEGQDDAVELLERGAQTLADLETFAFEMNTVRGSSSIMQGFELKSVTGVVRRPTDLEAEVEVSLPFGEMTIGAISLDDVFYIEDPLSNGAWMELGEMGEIQALINPDVLILRAVELVQNARVIGTAKIDGANAHIVEGEVDFSGLLDEFGQGQAEATQFLAGEPVLVNFWIDEKDRIVEVEIVGPILASESEDVVRVVELFDFNQEVDIEAPENVSTPGA